MSRRSFLFIRQSNISELIFNISKYYETKSLILKQENAGNLVNNIQVGKDLYASNIDVLENIKMQADKGGATTNFFLIPARLTNSEWTAISYPQEYFDYTIRPKTELCDYLVNSLKVDVVVYEEWSSISFVRIKHYALSKYNGKSDLVDSLESIDFEISDSCYGCFEYLEAADKINPGMIGLAMGNFFNSIKLNIFPFLDVSYANADVVPLYIAGKPDEIRKQLDIISGIL